MRDLRREARAGGKEAVADLTLENRLLKKACLWIGTTTYEVSSIL
jgi:hypothetical protein